MFRIVPERTAWWPVTFPGVTEDGKVVENRIELRFRILDEDEVIEFFEAIAKVNADAAADRAKAAAASLLPVLRTVVLDWRGVGAANDEPLPFNDENFLKLLKVPNVSVAIGRAYGACRSAVPELREGN